MNKELSRIVEAIKKLEKDKYIFHEKEDSMMSVQPIGLRTDDLHFLCEYVERTEKMLEAADIRLDIGNFRVSGYKNKWCVFDIRTGVYIETASGNDKRFYDSFTELSNALSAFESLGAQEEK